MDPKIESKNNARKKTGADKIRSHTIDAHVGMRLKCIRVLAGLTQREVAAIFDIRFQQIHKYETGENRVSASRLFEFGRFFDVDIEFFFLELPDACQPYPDLSDQVDLHIGKDLMLRLCNSEALNLVQVYRRIFSAQVRFHVLGIIQKMESPA